MSEPGRRVILPAGEDSTGMNKKPRETSATSVPPPAWASTRPARAWRLRFWLLLLALAAQLTSFQAAAAGVDVIVNPDQGAIQIDRAMLRAIFTTRLRQWPDGTPIRVFVLPDDSPVHDQFCREQLGMYPYVLRELWDRLLYTGTGLTPTVVRSESEMRAHVHDTAGAIGYTSAALSATPSRGADSAHASPDKGATLAFAKDPP
jgi:hypothetical protein